MSGQLIFRGAYKQNRKTVSKWDDKIWLLKGSDERCVVGKPLWCYDRNSTCKAVYYLFPFNNLNDIFMPWFITTVHYACSRDYMYGLENAGNKDGRDTGVVVDDCFTVKNKLLVIRTYQRYTKRRWITFLLSTTHT